LDGITRRPVVIKTARDESDQARTDLLREYRVACDVGGGGVVRAIDLPEALPALPGGPFLVLEQAPGNPWPRGPIESPRAARLLIGLLDALIRMHEHGWLHLDLTPANILVDGDEVTLIDLGHARRPAAAAALCFVHGTRGHIAPEISRQIDGASVAGDRIAATADLYQVGLLAVRLLSGEEPPAVEQPPPSWWREGVERVLAQHQGDVERWSWWIESMLAPLPMHRYDSARLARLRLGSWLGLRVGAEPRGDPSIGSSMHPTFPRLLRTTSRGCRSGRHLIRLNGPPGSGQSWLLHRLARALRCRRSVACRLAWTSAGHQAPLGDTGDDRSPLVVLADDPTEACWRGLLALDDLRFPVTVVFTGGPAPSRCCDREWERIELPIAPLGRRAGLRIVRPDHRRGLRSSLHGGHPGLLLARHRDERVTLAARVADWLEARADDRGALRSTAARAILSPMARWPERRPPEAEWRAIGRLSVDVARELASRIPRRDLTTIEAAETWRSNAALDRGRAADHLAIEAHAELGDPSIARRRLWRAIARRRREGAEIAERHLIRLGVDLGLLPRVWGLRMSRLAEDPAAPQSYRPDAELALDALPAWSRSASLLHARIARSITSAGDRREGRERARLLCRMARSCGDSEREAMVRIKSWPWTITTGGDLSPYWEELREIEELVPDGESPIARTWIAMGHILLRIRELYSAHHSESEPREQEILDLRRLTLEAHKTHRTERSVKSAATSGTLLLALQVLLERHSDSAFITRFLSRFARRPAGVEPDAACLINELNWSDGLNTRSVAELVRRNEPHARRLEALRRFSAAADLSIALGCAALSNGQSKRALAYLARGLASAPRSSHELAFNNQIIAAADCGEPVIAREAHRRMQLLRPAGTGNETTKWEDLWAELLCLSAEKRHSELDQKLDETTRHHSLIHPDDQWLIWRLRIDCRLAEGGAALRKALDMPTPSPPDSGNREVLPACLAAARGLARLGKLERRSPFLKNLLRWSPISRLANACGSAAAGELCLQEGNQVMALRRFTRAEELFGLLGWKPEVARCARRIAELRGARGSG